MMQDLIRPSPIFSRMQGTRISSLLNAAVLKTGAEWLLIRV